MSISRSGHPRLFFKTEDIPLLRKRAETTHRPYLDQLRLWAEFFEQYDPLPGNPLPDGYLGYYFENMAAYIMNMALLYHLTGEERYECAAKKWLLGLCSYSVEPKREPPHFKGHIVGAALGYDLLYDRLTREERIQVRDHLTQINRAVYELIFKENTRWTGLGISHSYLTRVACAGIGAAAVYDEVPESSEWLDHWISELKDNFAMSGEDGAFLEGPACWAYDYAPRLMFLEALRNTTGENLFDFPAIRNSIYFRLYTWLPDNSYIALHDSGKSGRYAGFGSASCHLLRKLASEYNDGYGQWLADQDEAYDIVFRGGIDAPPENWHLEDPFPIPLLHCAAWNFLWYNPAVEAQSPLHLPYYHHFENAGLIIVRSGWSPGDLVFSFQAGPIGGYKAWEAVKGREGKIGDYLYHAHAAGNEFTLFAGGRHLAIGPGYEFVDSAFHNTLVIDGARQPWDHRYWAQIKRTDFGDGFSYFVGDGSHCFSDALAPKSWLRHVVYLPPKTFVMCDEIQEVNRGRQYPSRIYRWQVNLDERTSEIDMIPEIRTIRIVPNAEQKQKGTLEIRFLHPQRLFFEESKIISLHGQLCLKRVAGMVKGPYVRQYHHQFLVVLSILDSPEDAAPEARLIGSDNLIGAVIDNHYESHCVVFPRAGFPATEDATLSLEVTAKKHLTCYIFSLQPNTTYDLTSTAEQETTDQFRHSITIERGTEKRTNSAGSFIIRV